MSVTRGGEDSERCILRDHRGFDLSWGRFHCVLVTTEVFIGYSRTKVNLFGTGLF